MFGYFPEVPVTKIRVSAPAPYKNPSVRNSNATELLKKTLYREIARFEC